MIGLMIWKLIAGMTSLFVIAFGGVAIAGAALAIACLRDWQQDRQDEWW